MLCGSGDVCTLLVVLGLLGWVSGVLGCSRYVELDCSGLSVGEGLVGLRSVGVRGSVVVGFVGWCVLVVLVVLVHVLLPLGGVGVSVFTLGYWLWLGGCSLVCLWLV